MRALTSLTDKTNTGKLAKSLQELGYEIISTGGTYKGIEKSGVNVIGISKVTNFPGILQDRVKTLSPYVYGGVLYRRDNEEHKKTIGELNAQPIDIVVVNLYDFQNALKTGDHDNIAENIDIGGPTLIRSAAKNYKDVLIVIDPSDYDEPINRLKNDSVNLAYREELAMKAFNLTAYYDSVISRYSQEQVGERNKYRTFGFKKEDEPRYGENSHQSANLYIDPFVNGKLTDCEVVHGKAMSFNNYNDLNIVMELADELGANSCVVLKHQSPCGVATANNVSEAYRKTYLADSTSIFGGIIAISGVVGEKCADEMSQIFLEIIAVRDFDEKALEVLTKKKSIRLVKIKFDNDSAKEDIKYLNGKVLIQDKDFGVDEYGVVTDERPSDEDKKDLEFAMKVVKFTKSNTTVLVKNSHILGIGGGQTSRIWALENIANNHLDVDFSSRVLASDVFFPLSDCVEFVHKLGVKAIIQPSGSIKDQDSIDKCNEYGINMVFTKNRHFKH